MTTLTDFLLTTCPDWCGGPHGEDDEPDHFTFVRDLVGPEHFSVHLRCPRDKGSLATVVELAFTTERPGGGLYESEVPMSPPMARSLAAALLDAAERAER